jgi:hypothetical protein
MSVMIEVSRPAEAKPVLIARSNVGSGQIVTLRFEIEGSVGKLFLFGMTEPVIVLDNQPIDVKVSA